MLEQENVCKDELGLHAERHFEAGLEYLCFGSVDKAYQRLSDALALYEEAMDDNGIAYAKSAVADILLVKGQHKDAANLLKQARAYFCAHDLREYARLAIPLSVALENDGWLAEAGEVVKEALVCLLQVGDDEAAARCRQRYTDLFAARAEIINTFERAPKIGKA